MNYPNRMFLFFVFSLFTLSLAAETGSDGNVNFEIYNKDSAPILVTLKPNAGRLSPPVENNKVEAGAFLRASVPSNPEQKLNLKIEVAGNMYYYDVSLAGKTAYVSFDSKHKPRLYPQTGPKMGIWKKTKSGLSLKNNLAASQISETTAQVEKKEKQEKDEIAALPEKIRPIAMRLKESSYRDAGGLLAAVLKDEKFRDLIDGITIPADTNELIGKLVEVRTLQQVKANFGPIFAGRWQEMLGKGAITLNAWNDPSADQIRVYAEAYLKELKNNFLSAELLQKYLPNGFEQIDKLDRFTSVADNIKAVDSALFQSVMLQAPHKLEFENSLPEIMELVRYAAKITKGATYPVDVIGKAVTASVEKLGDIKKSITKGQLFGWNLSKEFETEFAESVFKEFIAQTADLDFGQTQLVANFFRGMKYPASNGDFAYSQVLAEYFREKMKAGYSFTDVNSALVKNLKYDPKTSAKEALNLKAALFAIELQKPKIDGEKLFSEIRSHPLVVVGAVLHRFIADLLPEKIKKKADVIKQVSKELDSFTSVFSATGKIRKILDSNRAIIISLLPVALNDTARAAQDLMRSSLNTVKAKIDNRQMDGEITQLGDLVTWIMDHANRLKTNPAESLFTDMPLTKNDQAPVRLALNNLRLAGLLDSFVGKKIIEKAILSSEGFKEQVPPEAQKKITQLLALMGSALTSAIPAIVKNFNVSKYLDFLVKVGEYRDQKMDEVTLKKEVWRLLEVLLVDVSKLTETLPHALETIRDFGVQKTSQAN